MIEQLQELPSDDAGCCKVLRRIVAAIGPLDADLVDPPLALTLWDASTIDVNRVTHAPEDVFRMMTKAVRGEDPELRKGARGAGLTDLFNIRQPEQPGEDPPWPDIVSHGLTFPAVRMFTHMSAYPEPVRYGPASLAQLVLEAAASETMERTLSAPRATLRWGPFWCARPGCPNLFVSPILQRDERACVTLAGYRTLLLSQYCSHACFLADKSHDSASTNWLAELISRRMSGHFGANA